MGDYKELIYHGGASPMCFPPFLLSILPAWDCFTHGLEDKKNIRASYSSTDKTNITTIVQQLDPKENIDRKRRTTTGQLLK